MKATNKNVYGAKVRQWFNKNLIFVKLSLSGQLALVTTWGKQGPDRKMLKLKKMFAEVI